MKLTLTRKQELTLIKRGLDSYLEGLNPRVQKKKVKKVKKGWDKKRLDKFRKSMNRTWTKKRNGKK